MDGPATLAALKAVDALKQTAIAFMTARVQPTEVEEYLNLGAVAVVPNPFDPMTLSNEVRNILVERSGSEQSRSSSAGRVNAARDCPR